MALTGIAIAYSTVVFQTITHNRILTPSVMGLDALYMLIQTCIYFFFGSTSILVINIYYNFTLAIGAMILFALIFTEYCLKKESDRFIFTACWDDCWYVLRKYYNVLPSINRSE